MRPIPHQKRPRGRGNGRNNRPHIPNRAQTFDSNGPNIRVRGNAYQVLEKYLALARDATVVGDRIAAENYFQHAEHYFRTINQTGQSDPNRNGGQQQPRMTPADFSADGTSDRYDQDGEQADANDSEAHPNETDGEDTVVPNGRPNSTSE